MHGAVGWSRGGVLRRFVAGAGLSFLEGGAGVDVVCKFDPHPIGNPCPPPPPALGVLHLHLRLAHLSPVSPL